MNSQKTIKESIELEGVGLHNGLKVKLCIKPADVDTGIKFKRVDVESSKNIIEANYQNVISPILCTKIENSYGVSVSTIEHLMAAFYGEGIDNAIVELDASEVPIMDGSSFDFVESIRSAGTENQKSPKRFIKVLKKVELKDKQKSISIEPLNDDAKVAISEEVDSLFTKYGDKFSDIDRTEIKQLLYSKDPMDALKKAHAYLQEQKVPGIAPPAMILKKYQSDAAVKRHIGEALSMLNDYTKPEDSDKSISEIIKDAAGFFKGRLTEKAKHPLYQKFMAIATAGTLTKRHDLIGSQMTEGELRFTEPMFVSPHDTPASLRVKLETLLADATFNMDLTQRMFSEEAGYNASLWTEGGFNSAADMGK